MKGDYIRAVDGRKALVCHEFTLEGSPFYSEAPLNEFILSDIVCTRSTADCGAVQSIEDNDEIVFPHGDLAPRNMLDGERAM